MKTDLDSEKEKLEQAQNDLSAWKFTPDRWCCRFLSATLNDLLTTVLNSYVLFTRSLFCAKWIRSDTEMDRFCSHGTASFHEQCVYTEPFCCCPLLEAQMETRTGPRRHRIVYTYEKAEYLMGVLPTCTRPFTRYCCCLFSPVETKMRYGTDCIRPKSPVYTSETERYGSNKKRYLTVWIYIVVSHAAVFGSSRNAPPQEMAAYIRTVGEERCVTRQKRLRRRQV